MCFPRDNRLLTMETSEHVLKHYEESFCIEKNTESIEGGHSPSLSVYPEEETDAGIICVTCTPHVRT